VIYHDLVLRDKLDTEREIGAMKKAVGAFELDTSNKSITECIEILRKEFNKISNN
jgi:cytidylate kinase